jgi:hypothetical protein
MATSPIATAADYADAMLVARRAKNWLFLLLILSLLAQIGVFLALRLKPEYFNIATSAGVSATTQPSSLNFTKVLEYLICLVDFLGIALVFLLSMVLLLLTTIMLVGRLIGVSRVTSAYVWCLVLGVVLFPWQSLLSSPIHSSAGTAGVQDYNIMIPGALTTWGELTDPVYGARFEKPANGSGTFVVLRWARFVGFPALAVILLLSVQSKSSRGLRMALGEVEYDVGENAAGV